MRVRSGGSGGRQGDLCECWGVDPTGSFFVLASGVGGIEDVVSRTVCENIVHSLVPHRTQIDDMAADSRPDSRQKLLGTLCGALLRAERALLEMSDPPKATAKAMASCDLVYLANGTAYIAHIGNNRV